MKKFLFILCLCFITSTTIVAKPNMNAQKADRRYTISLDDAIQIAYRNRPNLLAYKHMIEASRMAAKQELSGYFPTINLNSDIVQTKGDHNPYDITQISVKQLVYSFSGPIEKYKKAKKNTDIVKLENKAYANEIRNKVELAFLDGWLSQTEYSSMQALYNSTTETFKYNKHQNKLQLLDKKDWLKSTTEHAYDLANFYKYEDRLASAQRYLEFLMGQPFDFAVQKKDSGKKIILQEDPNKIKITLDWDPNKKINIKPLRKYYELAFKNRPEIKKASKNIEIAQDDIDIAMGAKLPEIYASGNVNHTGGNEIVVGGAGGEISKPGQHSNFQIGLGITWSIFDGLLNSYKADQAQANKLKAILDKDQTLQQIKYDVESAYYALLQALKDLKAKNAEYIQTKNDFILNKQQFEIGEISKVDFEAAKTTWEKAKLTLIISQIALTKAERNLMYSSGYPEQEKI